MWRIFPFNWVMCRQYEQQRWAILVFRWSSSILQISELASLMTSCWKIQSTSLDDLSIPIEPCDQSCQVEWLQIFTYWWTSQSILQQKWLFITTYKDAPITEFQYLHTCIICENSIFDLHLRQPTSRDLKIYSSCHQKLCLKLVGKLTSPW